MATNPYEPVLLNEAKKPVRHRSTRAFINWGMIGGVLAIVGGACVYAQDSQVRLFVPLGLFSVCTMIGYSFLAFSRDGEDEMESYQIMLTVFLIWILLPISAAVNACSVVMNVEPEMDGSWQWWGATVPLILLGLSCTMAYFHVIKRQEVTPSGHYFVIASWGLQILYLLARSVLT